MKAGEIHTRCSLFGGLTPDWILRLLRIQDHVHTRLVQNGYVSNMDIFGTSKYACAGLAFPLRDCRAGAKSTCLSRRCKQPRPPMINILPSMYQSVVQQLLRMNVGAWIFDGLTVLPSRMAFPCPRAKPPRPSTPHIPDADKVSAKGGAGIRDLAARPGWLLRRL